MLLVSKNDVFKITDLKRHLVFAFNGAIARTGPSVRLEPHFMSAYSERLCLESRSVKLN